MWGNIQLLRILCIFWFKMTLQSKHFPGDYRDDLYVSGIRGARKMGSDKEPSKCPSPIPPIFRTLHNKSSKYLNYSFIKWYPGLFIIVQLPNRWNDLIIRSFIKLQFSGKIYLVAKIVPANIFNFVDAFYSDPVHKISENTPLQPTP